MSMARSLHHLSYHDHGLVGVKGAMTILGALSYNPFATQLTLSHNQLGDEGVEYLAHGILQLRKSGRSISPLRELNLSSNGITDKGLVAVISYLLLPSEPPNSQLPTLTELILSNNDISLSGSTPHILSTALSHPLSSLVTLSLNTNRRIAASPSHLNALLRNLEPTSLRTLQLNACGLEPGDARTIADWLTDPQKGGKIAHLELNANCFGMDSLGTNRIAKAVYSGLNTSLVRLELSANERHVIMFDIDGTELPPAVQGGQQDERPQETTTPSGSGRGSNTESDSASPADTVLLGDDLPWNKVKEHLSKALMRNHVLRESTRHSALALLPVARVLLHAKPASRLTPTEIQEQVLQYHNNDTAIPSTEDTRPNAQYTYTQQQQQQHDGSTALPSETLHRGSTSPLLKLPDELVRYILRSYTALEPIPLPPHPRNAKTFNPTQTDPPNPPTFASPLSETQFNRILSLAHDRSSLSGMTQRFGATTGSLTAAGQRKGSHSPRFHHGRVSLHDPRSFLWVVGCTDYERVSVV